MRDVKTRVKEGGRAAATVASDLGKKAVKQVALAADDLMVKLGDAAKRRRRARKAKSALKTVGKVALVVGAGTATVIGARRVLAANNSRGRKRK